MVTVHLLVFQHFSPATWSLVLQQGLLFILIVGRWILPRGSLGHQKLSNVLLLQIAMAADILEFLSEGLRTEEVLCLKPAIIGTLVLWSASLLQLPFHWDTKVIRRISQAAETQTDRTLLKRCANNEVWDNTLAVFLQDLPFLCMRMYFLSVLGIFNQALMFFISKNILVLVLQFYRLWSLLCLETDLDGNVSNRWATKLRATLRGSRNKRNNKVNHEQGESKDRDKFQIIEETIRPVVSSNSSRDHRKTSGSNHDCIQKNASNENDDVESSVRHGDQESLKSNVFNDTGL